MAESIVESSAEAVLNVAKTEELESCTLMMTRYV